MKYAINEQLERIESIPNTKGKCPICNSEVISKCGDIKIWHWAHTNLQECDSWHEGETEWHRSWKGNFPETNQEVIVTDGVNKHIADVKLDCGLVIEFQHSPISVFTVQEREVFYDNMIWVVDTNGWKQNFVFNKRNGERGTYYTFRWKHARSAWLECGKSFYLDLNNGYLFEPKKMYLDNCISGWGLMHKQSDFLNALTSE